MTGSRLLIAGGHSGGHVLAGIAVADAWSAAQSSKEKVLFVGAKGGLEERLVPRAGYLLKKLRVGSLNRVGLKRRAKTLFQLPLAFFYSAFLLLSWRPQFVLGVGGFSSGPLVLMARILSFTRLLNVRVAILEQNSIPGMTNRILGRFTHLVFTAFPQMDAYFPSSRVIQSGNPIRAAIQRMPSAPRDPFTLFIFGGSQGAMGINSLVLAALPFLVRPELPLSLKLQFVHQTGEKDYTRVVEGYQKQGISARVEKFIDDMPSVYQESSLLICRAGSSTLSEIAAVGRASVLIPLPTAADNHQELNAQVLARAKSAICLSQSETSGEKLAAVILDLVLNPENLDKMERSVTQFYFPNAVQNIVQGLLQNQ